MFVFRNQKDDMGSKSVRFTLKNEESFCQKVLKLFYRAWEKEGGVSAAQGVEGVDFFTNVNVKYCLNAASFRKPSERWENDEFSAREKYN